MQTNISEKYTSALIMARRENIPAPESLSERQLYRSLKAAGYSWSAYARIKRNRKLRAWGKLFNGYFMHTVNMGRVTYSSYLIGYQNMACEAMEAGKFDFQSAAKCFSDRPAESDPEDFFWSKEEQYQDGDIYNLEFYDALFFGCLKYVFDQETSTCDLVRFALRGAK